MSVILFVHQTQSIPAFFCSVGWRVCVCVCLVYTLVFGLAILHTAIKLYVQSTHTVRNRRAPKLAIRAHHIRSMGVRRTTPGSGGSGTIGKSF